MFYSSIGATSTLCVCGDNTVSTMRKMYLSYVLMLPEFE